MARVAGLGRLVGGLLASLACAGASLGAPPLSEQDFLADLPVVLSVSRLAQPKQEAPAAITVIDRALIDASPAMEITDLLRLVPGFQVGQVSGSERTISSHGMADQLGRRMQVLVDGRSVYDPFFGGALWQSLPLSLADVERIEVVRGPNAAAFGANAFQGAINIVTRAPGPRTETRAQLVAGSRDTQRIDLAQDWLAGAHRLQLSAGLQQDDGFPVRHDSRQAGRLNGRLDSQLSPRDKLELLVGIQNADIGTGYPQDPFQPPRTNDLSHHYGQLRWQRFLDGGADLTLQLYHTDQDSNDRYDYVIPGLIPPGTYFIDRGFSAKRSDAELQWRGSIAAATRLVIGMGARLERGESRFGMAPDADNDRTQYRVFAHGEQRLAQHWLLQGGLMVEDFEGVGTFTSPRLSLNYRYRPGHALRISAARGYRTPSLFEQDAYFGIFQTANNAPVLIGFIAPVPLEPESIIAYELGLMGELAAPRLTYDIKLFHHAMDDLVFAAENAATSQWEFQNNGQLDVTGLELGLEARLGPSTRLHLAYSLADADGQNTREFGPGGVIRTDDLGPTVPRHTVGLLLSHRFAAGWAGSLSWSFVDAMEWTGEGDPVSEIQRLDMKLGRELRLMGSDVRLELIAQNLLNDPFYDFNIPDGAKPGNQFSRRIYGQVVIRH
jgi:iron complex outermembrane receptor protein